MSMAAAPLSGRLHMPTHMRQLVMFTALALMFHLVPMFHHPMMLFHTTCFVFPETQVHTGCL